LTESFHISLNLIQPSQLYINNEKLQSLIHKYKSIGNHLYPPVTLKILDGQIIFTDGHTRALALFLKDEKDVKVIWEKDDLNWDAYRMCVRWCKDVGIHRISDLRNRIIDSNAYEDLWIKRCRNCRN
jgi:hypothetical protein